jgi:hypothetical protein
VTSTTDEEVRLVYPGENNWRLMIPNLSWLIPLALYTADTYEVLHVRASMAEVIDAPEHRQPVPDDTTATKGES